MAKAWVEDIWTSKNHTVSRDQSHLSAEVSIPILSITFSIHPIEMAESMPADCNTLFIKGLPYTFKEDDIGDRFRRFGEIKAIRIAYNW